MTREWMRRIRGIAGSGLPTSLHERAASARDRIREYRADRQFRARELPAVSTTGNTPRHVLVLVVDALRADMVGPDLTPHLAGLGGTNAVGAAPWTYPAVASMLSGLYPHEHGAMRRTDDPDNVTSAELTVPPALADEVRLLPEWFEAAGYETYGGFAFYMPYLVAGGRFGRHRIYRNAPAERVLEDYREWLSGRRERRTFAYLHLDDLHEPVDPPERYWEHHSVDRSIPGITDLRYNGTEPDASERRYREHRRRLYWAAADYVDDQIGWLVDGLDDLGVEPLVVVTADHGEIFWEHVEFDAERFYDSRPSHGVGHGGTPYESVARVPLLGRGVSFGAPASHVDLAPTLLDAAGIEVGERTTGVIHGTGVDDDRVLLIESARYGYEKKATYYRDYKLIASRGDRQQVGFSLPEEAPTDLPSNVESRLVEALPDWPEGGSGRSVSPSVRKRLEDLGYI